MCWKTRAHDGEGRRMTDDLSIVLGDPARPVANEPDRAAAPSRH